MGNVTEFNEQELLEPWILVNTRFQSEQIDKIRSNIDGKQDI